MGRSNKQGKLTHSDYSIENGHGGMKRNRPGLMAAAKAARATPKRQATKAQQQSMADQQPTNPASPAAKGLPDGPSGPAVMSQGANDRFRHREGRIEGRGAAGPRNRPQNPGNWASGGYWDVAFRRWPLNRLIRDVHDRRDTSVWGLIGEEVMPSEPRSWRGEDGRWYDNFDRQRSQTDASMNRTQESIQSDAQETINQNTQPPPTGGIPRGSRPSSPGGAGAGRGGYRPLSGNELRQRQRRGIVTVGPIPTDQED